MMKVVQRSAQESAGFQRVKRDRRAGVNVVHVTTIPHMQDARRRTRMILPMLSSSAKVDAAVCEYADNGVTRYISCCLTAHAAATHAAAAHPRDGP
jgi:hypothetical protein